MTTTTTCCVDCHEAAAYLCGSCAASRYAATPQSAAPPAPVPAGEDEPELPAPSRETYPFYSAQQMYAFARAALRTRTPGPAVIDDAMVERFMVASMATQEAIWPSGFKYADAIRESARAGLTAALAPEQGNNDV